MNEIIKFLKVFTFNFPGQFFIVIVAVFIQALANSLSVIAIGPLAEVLLQTKPEDYSQVTLFVSNLFPDSRMMFGILSLTNFIYPLYVKREFPADTCHGPMHRIPHLGIGASGILGEWRMLL